MPGKTVKKQGVTLAQKRKYRRQGRRRFKKRIPYKVLKGAYKAYRYLNPEQKYVDELLNAAAVSNTGTFKDMPAMTRGTAVSERMGDQIKMTSMYYKYNVSLGTAATINILRLMVIIDKQPNGARPLPGDILQNTGTNLICISPYNLANNKRFIILHDEQMSLVASATSQSITGSFYKELDYHTRYNTGNTGNVADIETNNLLVYIVSNQTSVSSQPTINIYSRLRFVDN